MDFLNYNSVDSLSGYEVRDISQEECIHKQVGSPLAIEHAHRNLLDMEDDE